MDVQTHFPFHGQSQPLGGPLINIFDTFNVKMVIGLTLKDLHFFHSLIGGNVLHNGNSINFHMKCDTFLILVIRREATTSLYWPCY